MIPPDFRDRSPARPPPAMLAALALMALEILVAISGFTTPPGFLDRSLTWTVVLHNRQTLFGALLLGAVMAVVLLGPRRSEHWRAWVAQAGRSRGPWPLLVQVASCLLCYALAWPLYAMPAEVGPWGWPLLIAWLASLGICALASLWLLAPLSWWRALVAREARVVLLAGAGMLAGGGLIALLFRAWTAVPWLVQVTLNSSAWLLRLVYPDAVVDPATAIIEVDGFRVQISDACSGYLGISLTLAFLACYGYLFRDELRPWLMAALLPLGVSISLALNALRIALLVMLGVEVSPELAVAGFHTHAGSIAMVITWLLVVGVVHRFAIAPAAAAAADGERIGWVLDHENALLVPLMVLLASTLLTGALSGHFVWLYPLRVLLVAIALRICWKALAPVVDWTPRLPYLAGIAAFAVWLLLIDEDAAASARFAAALDAAPAAVAQGWLLFRALGAVVTVPIAEELAFRGYLLALLSRQPVRADAAPAFDALGVAGSSLLFGALHGQWLAGTVVGLIYAAVRLARGRLWDAVLAHATTNLLLAAYVVATGRWSYW